MNKHDLPNIYNMTEEREFRISKKAHIGISYTGTGEYAQIEDFSNLVR